MKNLLCYSLILIISLIFFACKSDDSIAVYYGESFEDIKSIAKKQNKPFCIVLSKPDCPPCQKLAEIVEQPENELSKHAVFNFVNTKLPENRWYIEWIAVSATPATLVFSPEGEMQAIVGGSSAASMRCVYSTIKGKNDCADYMAQSLERKKIIPYEGNQKDLYKIFDNVLNVKFKIEKGKDLSKEVNDLSAQIKYPYLDYLKLINAQNNNNKDESLRAAEDLLSYDEPHYIPYYKDLYHAAKKVIDPNFNPDDLGRLTFNEEQILLECEAGKPHIFEIELSNTGRSKIYISDIQISCSCVDLLGNKPEFIVPDEKIKLSFKFFAEKKGSINRQIYFFTDAFDPVSQIMITANVN